MAGKKGQKKRFWSDDESKHQGTPLYFGLMLGARIAHGWRCCWRKMRVFLMGKRGRLRGSKYTVGFKRQLVAESLCEGASVLKVSRRHLRTNAPALRTIYCSNSLH